MAASQDASAGETLPEDKLSSGNSEQEVSARLNVETSKDGIILIPQPSGDPQDPLVCCTP